ncbi:MAG TPA: YhjD/YihY/BrkB family envelope integrity protein [Acidobacteriota bacterium]
METRDPVCHRTCWSGSRTYWAFHNRYWVTYGSLGDVIVLLIWFYLTALAMLTGAEINALSFNGDRSACGA